MAAGGDLCRHTASGGPTRPWGPEPLDGPVGPGWASHAVGLPQAALPAFSTHALALVAGGWAGGPVLCLWLWRPLWFPCMASAGPPPAANPEGDGVLFLVSEAYHLGQEETDWFDKPRDARSDRFRHHGGHAVSSSSQKRGPARHSYHDYDEPPEEGLWPHDEAGPSRHTSAKEHRHHSDHGRHSGRHAGEEPGRRAAKPHVRDQGRHEARPHPQPSSAPAMQKKGQPGYSSPAEYSQPSRAPSAYHHASDSKKGSRQAHSGPAALQPKPEPQPQPQSQGRQGPPGPQQSQPPPSRQTPSATSSRQPQTQQQQQQQPGHGLQHPQQTPAQARLQQQGQPTARGPAPAASQPAGKPQPGPTTATGPQQAGPVSGAPVQGGCCGCSRDIPSVPGWAWAESYTVSQLRFCVCSHGQSRQTALKGQPKHPSRGSLLRPSHHQDLDLQVSLHFGALGCDPKSLGCPLPTPTCALSSPAMYILTAP